MKAQIEIETDQPGHFIGAFGRVVRAILGRLEDDSLKDGTSLGTLRGAGKEIGFYGITFEDTGIPMYCTQNGGDCQNCSLRNYNRDCKNNPITRPAIDQEGESGRTGQAFQPAGLETQVMVDGNP